MSLFMPLFRLCSSTLNSFLLISSSVLILFSNTAFSQFIHEGVEPAQDGVESTLETGIESGITLGINPVLGQTAGLGYPPATQILRGKIVSFDFTQPETLILLETDFQQWQLKAPSAVELRRLGWSSASLFSGELVEVEVEPQPDSQTSALLKRLTRANGALLITALTQPEPKNFEGIAGGMYALDRDHADLQIAFNHLGFSSSSIRFERLNADVLWNAQSPETSIIQINIDASSLRSAVAELDNILRADNFFDSLNYPKIQFKSTRLKLVKWGSLQVEGQLEIKGINHPIQLEARLNKQGIHPVTQQTVVGIALTGTLNRSDWGLSDYAELIEDSIEISFQGEFILRAGDIPSALPGAQPSAQPGTTAPIMLRELANPAIPADQG